MKKTYWISNIQGVYDVTSGALASATVLETTGANVTTYQAVSIWTDKYTHVLWNPEAAHQTESNLTKFLNRHAGRVDSVNNSDTSSLTE